jgi:hypothetical protein
MRHSATASPGIAEEHIVISPCSCTNNDTNSQFPRPVPNHTTPCDMLAVLVRRLRLNAIGRWRGTAPTEIIMRPVTQRPGTSVP